MSKIGYWDKEYAAGSPHFTALSSEDPSISVKRFVQFLTENNLPLTGKVLELGCGMGRNSNYLAQQEFDVTGVDISTTATAEASKRAVVKNLVVNYQILDISKPWPFIDNSYDFILDFVTSHLLTTDQLAEYKKELSRTLKTGGLFVLYTLDKTKDAEAQKLLKQHPGPEPNTYILPEMGHMERTFSLEDIIQAFPFFKLKYSELIHRPTRFGDQTYDRYYWWAIFEK